MKIARITSVKHPGAIFLKDASTADDFVCKIYPRCDSYKITAMISDVLRNYEPEATIVPRPPHVRKSKC